MKCREFQKMIPDIINKAVPVNLYGEIIEHVENCKECYDELEIYYVLQYGLGDDDTKISMDFRGQLEANIQNMKKKFHRLELMQAIYILIQIMGYTAIGGSFIYVLFKFFL